MKVTAILNLTEPFWGCFYGVNIIRLCSKVSNCYKFPTQWLRQKPIVKVTYFQTWPRLSHVHCHWIICRVIKCPSWAHSLLNVLLRSLKQGGGHHFQLHVDHMWREYDHFATDRQTDRHPTNMTPLTILWAGTTNGLKLMPINDQEKPTIPV